MGPRTQDIPEYPNLRSRSSAEPSPALIGSRVQVPLTEAVQRSTGGCSRLADELIRFGAVYVKSATAPESMRPRRVTEAATLLKKGAGLWE